MRRPAAICCPSVPGDPALPPRHVTLTPPAVAGPCLSSLARLDSRRLKTQALRS